MDDKKDNLIQEDIYQEFEDFDLGKTVEKLQTENADLKNHINLQELNIKKLVDALEDIQKVNESLTKNISSLYRTAKSELDRKNNTIADLRNQLENKACSGFRAPEHKGTYQQTRTNVNNIKCESRKESIHLAPDKIKTENLDKSGNNFTKNVYQERRIGTTQHHYKQVATHNEGKNKQEDKSCISRNLYNVRDPRYRIPKLSEKSAHRRDHSNYNEKNISEENKEKTLELEKCRFCLHTSCDGKHCRKDLERRTGEKLQNTKKDTPREYKKLLKIVNKIEKEVSNINNISEKKSNNTDEKIVEIPVNKNSKPVKNFFTDHLDNILESIQNNVKDEISKCSTQAEDVLIEKSNKNKMIKNTEEKSIIGVHLDEDINPVKINSKINKKENKKKLKQNSENVMDLESIGLEDISQGSLILESLDNSLDSLKSKRTTISSVKHKVTKISPSKTLDREQIELIEGKKIDCTKSVKDKVTKTCPSKTLDREKIEFIEGKKMDCTNEIDNDISKISKKEKTPKNLKKNAKGLFEDTNEIDTKKNKQSKSEESVNSSLSDISFDNIGIKKKKEHRKSKEKQASIDNCPTPDVGYTSPIKKFMKKCQELSEENKNDIQECVEQNEIDELLVISITDSSLSSNENKRKKKHRSKCTTEVKGASPIEAETKRKLQLVETEDELVKNFENLEETTLRASTDSALKNTVKKKRKVPEDTLLSSKTQEENRCNVIPEEMLIIDEIEYQVQIKSPDKTGKQISQENIVLGEDVNNTFHEKNTPETSNSSEKLSLDNSPFKSKIFTININSVDNKKSSRKDKKESSTLETSAYSGENEVDNALKVHSNKIVTVSDGILETEKRNEQMYDQHVISQDRIFKPDLSMKIGQDTNKVPVVIENACLDFQEVYPVIPKENLMKSEENTKSNIFDIKKIKTPPLKSISKKNRLLERFASDESQNNLKTKFGTSNADQPTRDEFKESEKKNEIKNVTFVNLGKYQDTNVNGKRCSSEEMCDEILKSNPLKKRKINFKNNQNEEMSKEAGIEDNESKQSSVADVPEKTEKEKENTKTNTSGKKRNSTKMIENSTVESKQLLRRGRSRSASNNSIINGKNIEQPPEIKKNVYQLKPKTSEKSAHQLMSKKKTTKIAEEDDSNSTKNTNEIHKQKTTTSLENIKVATTNHQENELNSNSPKVIEIDNQEHKLILSTQTKINLFNIASRGKKPLQGKGIENSCSENSLINQKNTHTHHLPPSLGAVPVSSCSSPIQLPKVRKRITPTPVKDVPVCSFKNILEKNTGIKIFSKNFVMESSLNLTDEGEIPILHLEENHFNNMEDASQKTFDRSILKLLDCMNVSNLDCDISKLNEKAEVTIPSDNLTFENVIKSQNESNCHTDNVVSNTNVERVGIYLTPIKQPIQPHVVTSTPRFDNTNNEQASVGNTNKDFLEKETRTVTAVKETMNPSKTASNSQNTIDSHLNTHCNSHVIVQNKPAESVKRFRRRCRIIAVRKL